MIILDTGHFHGLDHGKLHGDTINLMVYTRTGVAHAEPGNGHLTRCLDKEVSEEQDVHHGVARLAPGS